MSDDASLVRAAQAGDVAGLGELLERHRALLHAVAVGMLGHGPEAEDAVHDTFLIALRRIGDLRDPAAARAWLLADPRQRLPGAAAPPGARALAEPPGRRPACRSRTRSTASRCATGCGPRSTVSRQPLRLAVVLRYFSGASSYDAIADLCGVPVGTVRSRLNAARAQLADALLETAAGAHPAPRARAGASPAGVAMTAFQRTGDAARCTTCFREDLRFRMADRVERRGRDRLRRALARDFEDGVTARVRSASSPAPISRSSSCWLDNPPDQPLHCPPAATQVHFHDGPRRIGSSRTTRRALADSNRMTNERGTAPAR